MYDNRPIGIFDSGVGGLTVLAEIEKLLPRENYVYLADQAHVPYGVKEKPELTQLTEKIVDFLIKKDSKLIVVACNTASVYSLTYLRSRFRIPIVGVVPVVKTIASLSKSGKAITFSTPATAKSPYLRELISKFAPNLEVFTLGGGHLEELIENGDLEDSKVDEVIKKTLMPYVETGVDVIGLACTHYPFLKDRIGKIVGPNIKIIDSGAAVARQVAKILKNENIESGKKSEDFYFTTGDEARFKHVAEKLLDIKLDHVGRAEL